MQNRKLFIGCSRGAKHIADWIANEIQPEIPSIEILVWDFQGNWRNAKSTLDSLYQMTKEFYYALLIYYPDDLITINGEIFFTTRDNVVFESGLFFSKYGDKRTFILKPTLKGHPSNNEFHVLTDFDGIQFTSYELLYESSLSKWNVNNSNQFTKDNIVKLCSDILKVESELNVLSDTIEANIERISDSIRFDLLNENQSDEFYLENFAEKYDTLIRFKGIQIDKTPQQILKDILISINKIDDVLDIDQLANAQSKASNPKISKVWVFADDPLEFRPLPNDKKLNKQLRNLKDTVLNNLRSGVKYVYFVNCSFTTKSLTSLVEAETKLLANIEVIKCDNKHFLTFFTLHFEEYHTKPTDIFVSLIDKDREDLLVKTPEKQKDRIFDNLSKIKGTSEVTDTFRMFDRANS